MSLYVDGALDASQEAWGAINVNDTVVQIGANTEMQDRFWNGLIDDVRVFNYGLPEAQVKELATGQVKQTCPLLKGVDAEAGDQPASCVSAVTEAPQIGRRESHPVV